MADPAGPIGPGDEVGGFVIESIAGRGGMGVVFRARQSKPDRVVALKVIAPELADDPAFRVRFERESTIAAQIEHPNVIPVHAVGEDAGVLFIAMRFVSGIDMRTLIAQEGRLEPRRAAAIVDQVAQALDAAHGHGLVHRDVKPANILLASVGGRDHVYLTDFGLSRHIEGSQAVTGTGAFLGTIDYVAPEQARAEHVDARTDVYSLGCVLFHALTGTVPFPLTSDLAKLYAHGTQLPPSVRDRAPGVPAAFDPVLMRAMAKLPGERYLSAGDLGRAGLLAAANASPSRTETNVAVGDAAPPGGVEAVPGPAIPAARRGAADEPTESVRQRAPAPPAQQPAPAAPPPPTPPTPTPTPRPPTPPPPTSGRRGRRRGPILAVVAAAALLAVILAAVLAGGGGGQPSGAKSRTPVVVGMVRGHTIGPVAIGQTPAVVTRTLTAAGYRITMTSQFETDFSLPTGPTFVVDYFDNGRVNQIHKYHDPSITINGVSISSTLHQARAALPGWYEIRCSATGRAILAAPGGRTFFELPLAPDTGNALGANGIDVVSSPVDRTFCR